MDRCPQCGRRVRLADERCPVCRPLSEFPATLVEGAPPSESDAPASDAEGVAIARLQSGAEAGYFADELLHTTGIEIEVLARERFDAVHAVWSVDYVLLAPREEAPRAAQMLQELVDGSDDKPDDGTETEGGRYEIPGGVWAPLLLTLAAGSIACWGVERANQRPRPPALVDRDPRLPPDVWHLLSATPGAWVQRSPDGTLSRELTVDPDHQSAVLREDRNGDGEFEQEWRFDWKQRGKNDQ